MELALDGGLAGPDTIVLTGAGIFLNHTEELTAAGCLIVPVRYGEKGNRAYFPVGLHINHTNVCAKTGELRAFGRETSHLRKYARNLDEIEAQVMTSPGLRTSDIHIVSRYNLHGKSDDYTLKKMNIKRRGVYR